MGKSLSLYANEKECAIGCALSRWFKEVNLLIVVEDDLFVCRDVAQLNVMSIICLGCVRGGVKSWNLIC